MWMKTSKSPADPDAIWASLSLTNEYLSNPDNPKTPPPLKEDALNSLLSSSHTASDFSEAIESSLQSYEAEQKHLPYFDETLKNTTPALRKAEEELEQLAERLRVAEDDAVRLRNEAEANAAAVKARAVTQAHLSAFVDEILVEPALIRHVVDGAVGESEYAQCLSRLSKIAALYDMPHMRETAVHEEMEPVLRGLLRTGVVKVRNFLMEKVALLKRPNTNVNIVKESVLKPHRAFVEFVEIHDAGVFREVRGAYVDTMSKTYYVLFRKYAAGLLTMKELLPSERQDTLVGSLGDESSLFGGKRSPGAGVGQFALGDRLKVLRDVEGPAVVLATASDRGDRFFYEQIHRSLGKMLSETCASEHMFFEEFFGESDGRMFDSFFRRIVGFLLEVVAAHTAPTRDAIGVLLALKVNEAQRRSMQKKQILDLSDYFIQVDILLKPKFKKLLDENVASMADASATVAKGAQKGEGDTSPHIVTRRFAEFSASVLAIARFGTPDDSIMEGLRRLRSEYNGFLNAMSTLFTRAKLRYIFLVNNIDLILTMFRQHDVVGTEDYRVFAELLEVHSAAFVEHEVADHFPDIVSFVRQFERTSKATTTPQAGRRAYPSADRVRAILRQFGSNWRLGVQHMQDNVLREFPSYDLGQELIRSLFARLLAYHKRSEAAINTEYSRLKVELVTGTEMVYELRKRTKDMT